MRAVDKSLRHQEFSVKKILGMPSIEPGAAWARSHCAMRPPSTCWLVCEGLSKLLTASIFLLLLMNMFEIKSQIVLIYFLMNVSPRYQSIVAPGTTMLFPGLFCFILVFSIAQLVDKILPMSGFEPRISDVSSDCYTD